jgi:hypothetical protein
MTDRDEADPPWLEAGYCIFRDAAKGPTKGARIYAGLQAFAAFIAAQPPSEAQIDHAAEELRKGRCGEFLDNPMPHCRHIARAALIAARRAGG